MSLVLYSRKGNLKIVPASDKFGIQTDKFAVQLFPILYLCHIKNKFKLKIKFLKFLLLFLLAKNNCCSALAK